MKIALAFCLGVVLPIALGRGVTYTKGSDGSNAHQYRNPCKVSVKAEPGMVVWKNLYLESRAYDFPVTVTAASGWKVVSAKYPNNSGQDVVLQPSSNAGAGFWQFLVPKNFTGAAGGRPIVTVHFATLRQTPSGAPDYQEDIVIQGNVVPDLTILDVDGDGMSDAWEQQHFGNGSHDGTADTDGDGVSDKDEYLQNTSPIDFWNGQDAIISIVSGDYQGDFAGLSLAQPLRVKVTNQAGQTKSGLAVAFGIISPAGGGSQMTPAAANTDPGGIAQSSLKLPTAAPGTYVIVRASIQGASVKFAASIGDPNVGPTKPGRPMITQNWGATEAEVEWEDRSNNETVYYVERTISDAETWVRSPALPANSTSYHDTGLLPNVVYTYRIVVDNDAP